MTEALLVWWGPCATALFLLMAGCVEVLRLELRRARLEAARAEMRYYRAAREQPPAVLVEALARLEGRAHSKPRESDHA